LTAKNQNFEMFQGDTKNIVVTVTGTDLTGASIKWAMKRSVSSTVVDVSKSIGNGISITSASPTSSVFEIKLDPADTINLKGDYYHEAEVKDAQNNVSTVMTGRISIQLSGV
jgi:hypothetical protein